jgi:drug/metabolite transporter (DMT)-like permease
MWLPAALLGSLISGVKRVYEKSLTAHFGNFSMGFIVQAFSLLPTLFLFLFFPLPESISALPWQFWWPLLIIWFVLYPVQTYLYYRSMREGELSSVTPLMALLPVFNVATSYFIIGETPSITGIIGILAIVLGVYLLLSKGKFQFHFAKAELCMVLAMMCVAVGSTLDKVAINASTPVFYSFMNTLGATIVFVVLMHVYNESHEFQKMRGKVLPFFILGIFQAISYTAGMIAFQYGPTSYVLAIRAGGYVLVSLYGIFILKESISEQKILALVSFSAGLALLAFA